MKIRKISALILTVGMLCACSSSSEDTIVIGGLASLSGTSSVYGISCTNGTRLAIKEINENGGILGKNVVFELQDEKGDIEEAINAYNKLSGRGVTVIIGDVMSKPCIAVAELAAEDGITLVTPTATADVITSFGDNIFRVCFTDILQGEVMARYAYENVGAKTVAVMYNTSDDYSSGIADAFSKEAENIGLSVIASEGYGADDKDFRSQLMKIRTKNPDVIFLPDYYTSIALIVSQARETGYDGILLGSDGWDGIKAAVADGNVDILNNCRYSAHFALSDDNAVVSEFVESYKREYGNEPTSLAALGYDSAYLVKAAIEKAGSTDSEAVTKALGEIELECVTGTISFDEEGNPQKDVAILTFEDGEIKLDAKKETY